MPTFRPNGSLHCKRRWVVSRREIRYWGSKYRLPDCGCRSMNDDTSRRSRRAVMRSVALGVAGGLAGCVGFDGSGSTSPQSTPAPETTDSTASPPPATTTSSTPPSTLPTTPTETWTLPATPLQPTEDKHEERINDVNFINKENAPDGNGYTNFDLQMGPTRG